MEIVTEELEPSQLEAEMPFILQWLQRCGVQELNVSFGVGCALPPERLWKPLPVQTRDLPEVVRGAIAAGAFAFGRADLYLHGQDFAFIFCHESDLHFRSDDASSVEDVRREWTARGYGGWESTIAGDWVPFSR
jgi:hypothetical protein